MARVFIADVSGTDGAAILRCLREDPDWGLVAYGEHAVDLQLPDAPSPHAVNLSASVTGTRLRLEFHMGDADVSERCRRLVERAHAHGIALVPVEAASPTD